MMAHYSIFNETLHLLNPEAELLSRAALDDVERHACIQSLHSSFIASMSTEEKESLCSRHNLSKSFFEDAVLELNKQLDLSEAETLIGIRALAQDTSLLLSSGGDDRLTLKMDSGKVNKYNASTFVRPGITNRGSCTCSSVTEEGLALAKEVHHGMLKDVISGIPYSQVLMEENDSIRQRLHSSLHVSPDSASIVLFPSGSDAELLPTIVALVKNSILRNNGNSTGDDDLNRKANVFSFVTGAGEVGSGTAKASGARHFSNTPTTASDLTVADGNVIEGVSEGDVEVIEFEARDRDGSINLKESGLCCEIRNKLTGDGSSPHSVTILHAVIGTKTGLVYPSLDLIRQLQSEFGERLVVVIDACQLRCKLSMLEEYIQLGAFVLITGSKYYCGPPFSGAVLVPRAYSLVLESHLVEKTNIVPKGLQSYLTPYDVPKDMPKLREFLTVAHNQKEPRKPWTNPGLTLRWSCALDTMSALAALPPDSVASYTKKWVQEVRRMVDECNPYLQCLEEKGGDGGSNSSVMPGGICSIVSFVVYAPDSEGKVRSLPLDEMKKLWVEMITGERRAALGQPVKLSPDVTVLRIALGAQIVVEALGPSSEDLRCIAQDKIQEQDAAIISKLKELCLQRWENHTSSK